MRLGKVFVDCGYVVDLDDPTMVRRARDTLLANLSRAIVQEEFSDVVASSADVNILMLTGFHLKDIPDFLKLCPVCGDPRKLTDNRWVCPNDCREE